MNKARKNIILFDDESKTGLYPLTLTRPTAEIRCGILTLRHKWELLVEGTASYITQEYLSEKYAIKITEDNYIINGNVLPNEKLALLIKELDFDEALMFDQELIAARLSRAQFDHLLKNEQIDELAGFELDTTPVEFLRHPWEIFQKNAEQIHLDYKLLTKGRVSQPIPKNNQISGFQIFIEPGAIVNHCILNAETGPIYIGKDAEIMEGAMIRGPFAACDKVVVKMGAKIYGATTIGPHSKIGGEINNSVIQGFSNKAHDGFLGNSVIGEWCNIGADTNSSNLKNNYSNIKMWDYEKEEMTETELQFCGLIMGDHSRTGINTMFNTGTTVGVGCNVFGGGFPSKFIPSYSWGGSEGFVPYKMEQLFETIEKVMARRNRKLENFEKKILLEINEMTGDYQSK